MRNIFMIAPLALLAFGAASLPGFAAERASLEMPTDKVHVGTGVICDTQNEVTRFVRLMEEQDAGGAMQTVNREANNPLACGMATVAFRPGKQIGQIRNGNRSFKILEIEVIAGTADGAWHVLSPRRTQFTAIPLEGLEI
jgi:hypothetical protein